MVKFYLHFHVTACRFIITVRSDVICVTRKDQSGDSSADWYNPGRLQGEGSARAKPFRRWDRRPKEGLKGGCLGFRL